MLTKMKLLSCIYNKDYRFTFLKGNQHFAGTKNWVQHYSQQNPPHSAQAPGKAGNFMRPAKASPFL